MLVDRAGLGVPSNAARGLVNFALASTSASFLLAMVSMVTNVEKAKFDAISCWKTVVLLAAVRARLARAVPRQLMVATRARITAWVLPNRPSPSDA